MIGDILELLQIYQYKSRPRTLIKCGNRKAFGEVLANTTTEEADKQSSTKFIADNNQASIKGSLNQEVGDKNGMFLSGTYSNASNLYDIASTKVTPPRMYVPNNKTLSLSGSQINLGSTLVVSQKASLDASGVKFSGVSTNNGDGTIKPSVVVLGENVGSNDPYRKYSITTQSNFESDISLTNCTLENLGGNVTDDKGKDGLIFYGKKRNSLKELTIDNPYNKGIILEKNANNILGLTVKTGANSTQAIECKEHGVDNDVTLENVHIVAGEHKRTVNFIDIKDNDVSMSSTKFKINNGSINGLKGSLKNETSGVYLSGTIDFGTLTSTNAPPDVRMF